MFKKRWVFFIPVILGIVVIVLLKQNKPVPQQKPAQETVTVVRTLAIPSLTVKPVAIGYGTVQPVSTWEAVAQVEGIITEKNPALGKGAIIEKGTLLLQIDPTDYELNITQIEADILANKAQLEELEIKLKNTQASLSIEKKSLDLTRKELKRLQNLVKKGSVSFSAVEAQERTMLAQQQSVQAQNNSLKLIPSQRALLEAQLQQKQSQLKSAQRDLDNTRISMPFTGRISANNVELAQYVRIGNTLTAADALDKAEIEVQIPIRYFRGLLRTREGESVNLLELSQQKLHEKMGIKAQVVLQEGGLSTAWDARFARLSDTLDPKTRTIGVIVEVDNPYGDVSPGSRPPLIKGFFVQVHLTGAARPGSLVVPRSALHNNQLYLMNNQNRLEILKVRVELYQPEFAIVSSAMVSTTSVTSDEQTKQLKAGNNIIVSDLVPAIEGMLLSGQQDTSMANRLQSLVNGLQVKGVQ
ncbi:MAG: hypothetical protein QNL62_16405 [Gammaproteobacteria bacterium]|nr:hypothetical protein [Gammaproteobacteria bacterium]